jgi:hypothetical protein
MTMTFGLSKAWYVQVKMLAFIPEINRNAPRLGNPDCGCNREFLHEKQMPLLVENGGVVEVLHTISGTLGEALSLPAVSYTCHLVNLLT